MGAGHQDVFRYIAFVFVKALGLDDVGEDQRAGRDGPEHRPVRREARRHGGDHAQSERQQFVVAGADVRNGSYKAFATNGTRQTLALNFDTSAYFAIVGANDPSHGTNGYLQINLVD